MGLGYAIALIAVLTIVFTAGGFYLRYRIYRDLNVAAREGDLDRFSLRSMALGQGLPCRCLPASACVL